MSLGWLNKQIMIRLHYYNSFVISILVVSEICFSSSYGHGVRYWVGDTVWSIPPYPNFYSDWSSSHLFRVGDSLVFDFETEMYNLMRVSALDYQSCGASNPIKVLNAGPATVLLNEQGVFYYLCNLSNYCDLGQKISVIVHNSNFPPAPSPSPSPSPAAAPVESPLTPLFAPVLSPQPSTDDCNVSAPASSQAPSSASPDLGHRKSSCSRLKCLGGCLSVFYMLLLFFFCSYFWVNF